MHHHDPTAQTGTGYCFDRYEPLDLFTCLIRAWEGFQYKDKWAQLQQRAMQQDFSWDRSAEQYNRLYHEVLGWELPAQTSPEAGEVISNEQIL